MATCYWQCPKCKRITQRRGIEPPHRAFRSRCPMCKTRVVVSFRWVPHVDHRPEHVEVTIPDEPEPPAL